MEGERISIWVTFKYERLLTICFVYGRIGHDRKRCLTSNNGQTAEYQYVDWIRANGNFKGSQERAKPRRDDINPSNNGGGRAEPQPPLMGIKDLADGSSGGTQKSSRNPGTEKARSWVALGDDDGSGCQAASQPIRCTFPMESSKI